MSLLSLSLVCLASAQLASPQDNANPYALPIRGDGVFDGIDIESFSVIKQSVVKHAEGNRLPQVVGIGCELGSVDPVRPDDRATSESRFERWLAYLEAAERVDPALTESFGFIDIALDGRTYKFHLSELLRSLVSSGSISIVAFEGYSSSRGRSAPDTEDNSNVVGLGDSNTIGLRLAEIEMLELPMPPGTSMELEKDLLLIGVLSHELAHALLMRAGLSVPSAPSGTAGDIGSDFQHVFVYAFQMRVLLALYSAYCCGEIEHGQRGRRILTPETVHARLEGDWETMWDQVEGMRREARSAQLLRNTGAEIVRGLTMARYKPQRLPKPKAESFGDGLGSRITCDPKGVVIECPDGEIRFPPMLERYTFASAAKYGPLGPGLGRSEWSSILSEKGLPRSLPQP